MKSETWPKKKNKQKQKSADPCLHDSFSVTWATKNINKHKKQKQIQDLSVCQCVRACVHIDFVLSENAIKFWPVGRRVSGGLLDFQQQKKVLKHKSEISWSVFTSQSQ